jgi:hypothetical protein
MLGWSCGMKWPQIKQREMTRVYLEIKLNKLAPETRQFG